MNNENKTKLNPKWSYIPNHPYRILIIGGLINNQPGIDKIYLYLKDQYEAKYPYLNNKSENVGLKR